MSLEEQTTSGVPGNETATGEQAQGQSTTVDNSAPAKTEPSKTEEAAEQPQAETVASAEQVPAADAAAETTAPIEQPVAAEAATQAPADAAPASDARKVELNPTQDPSTSKAVPSLGEAQGASAEQVPNSGPVDIPKADDLDDDLEAQLAAAMQGQSAPATTNPKEAAAGLPKDESELEPGTRLKGRVDSIDPENVLVDLGYRATGVISRRHFTDDQLPKVGEEIEVVVESINSAEGIIQLGVLRSAHRASGDWDTLTVGQVVECNVQKTNKGGLEIQVGQLRGFMPAGQVDMYFVGDLEPFVGQKLTARVIDVNPKKRNLVVSRKALLQEERAAAEAVAWQELAVGDQRTGTVKTIKDYGAFVDIGGVDGLLHVRELSWTRVNHPSDVLQEGQQVEVKVLSIDQEKKKISLGMKQLMTNPWDYAEQRYPKNTVVTGLVKKTTDFGAFVEIEPGLEGLIHISELDFRRVNRVEDVLTEGQETEAQVLEINKNKKRISLSLKSIKPKPEPTAEELAAEAASQAEEKQRREAEFKRRKTLKGGIGGNKGGGLFGNPSDY
ncbi:30S ribosomal protein S1 [Rubinisphaera sp. JC750]|uniref:30S ribosomal protein S1 n=1 Tax=Rubinisphaera sp. JC750 TaxID=2898658 RepID=UPI001F022B20|nr:S1 RNA-binding domain-containing protein [Rubinisphaera sp. JC750]